MKEFLGSVRQSLDFRNLGGGEGDNGGFGGLVEKIGSSIRKSRIGIFSIPHPVRALPPLSKNDVPPIRWRKGEMIGCGAFGRVYMGMNLNSGELLAVKQVLIAASSASKEKTQTQIRELEEEVKLLKNLSHPNIVRYLGTAREEDSLNILLEFVPGGSISSLLGKFGSFPESVIRMYTKQLLLGLDYLHKNGIMHRDIKGANILVDNKGCIKLADFGASKQVVELATMNGAKSMKGTPYWMAPEVILQTGHSFSADIWSVGCTVIEMATGKPPWSQQYQEVAALFHIGTTKSHPPIPEHLSTEVKDFLLKCLQKEPYLRPTASELLKHPFVTCELQEPQSVLQTSVMESANLIGVKNIRSSLIVGTSSSSSSGLKDVCQIGSLASSNTVGPKNYLGAKSTWGRINNDDDDDMCRIDDFTVGASMKFGSMMDNLNKSFNPMSEPTDDFPCKFDETLNMERNGKNHRATTCKVTDSTELFEKGQSGCFSFQSGVLGTDDDDDDEVTEPKIRAFLDEKALDLKKLQSPLYEEFYNTVNASSPSLSSSSGKLRGRDKVTKLPPKSKSPTNRLASRRFSAVITSIANGSREKRSLPSAIGVPNEALEDIQPHPPTEWRQLHDDAQKDPISSPSPSTTNCLEVHRKWEEELYQELERRREMLRQAGMGGGNISSPKEGILKRPRELPRFV